VSDRELVGLIVDWGGVLTSDLTTSMAAWAADDAVAVDGFRQVMRRWLGDGAGAEAVWNPVHALERGELEVPDFERRLAAELRTVNGAPVEPEGLLTRMFNRFEHAADMVGLVRRARAAGIRTALLSNSWGNDYPRDGWDEMFDVVVISGEVGMRKPEPRIFRHTLEQLGLEADQCVFVDDLRPNIRAATELGLVGILHARYVDTARELEILFGRQLAS
jgi:epoxide hydrolase-like predicted phosphatase